MIDIGKVLSGHGKYKPEHPAFVCGDTRWTFRELDLRTNQVAHAFLQAGLGKGSHIATLLPNGRPLYEIYWAAAKIGAVVVPLSPLLRGSGLHNLLVSADLSLIVTTGDMLPHLYALPAATSDFFSTHIWCTDEVVTARAVAYEEKCAAAPHTPPPDPGMLPDDLYNIIYSSGTTGEPKGIMISHQVRALYMSLFANYFRIQPESTILHSGSIIFNGAFLTLMPSMFLGATYILQEHFEVKEVIHAIKTEKVTHTTLVPSQIVQMLEDPDFTRDNLPSLEMIMTVGAPLHPAHKKALDERIPGVFYELYGLTEGFMTILDKFDYPRKGASVGYPPPLMEIKIVDEKGTALSPNEIGEITGRGPLLMQGYYKKPELTAEAIKDGWLYTGDLGYLDEDGFLFLTGRKKDLIISGSVNVYPQDIEAILVKHPAVKDAAVFGIPHERWGETPVAAVLCKPTSQPDPEELLYWVNERVEARFQKLSNLFILEDFPRNVAGKTLKREIRDAYLKRQMDGTLH